MTALVLFVVGMLVGLVIVLVRDVVVARRTDRGGC